MLKPKDSSRTGRKRNIKNTTKKCYKNNFNSSTRVMCYQFLEAVFPLKKLILLTFLCLYYEHRYLNLFSLIREQISCTS